LRPVVWLRFRLAATACEVTGTGAVEDGSDVPARIRVLERQTAMIQGEQVLAMAEWFADATDRHPRGAPAGPPPPPIRAPDESPPF
jgi:hypothetical protein